MTDHPRPAGVDPDALLEPSEPALTHATEIGRRVGLRVEAWLGARLLDGLGAEMRPIVAELVEAEIRSHAGPPPVGVVDVRLGYVEALLLTSVCIEAGGDTARGPEENRILADLRAKLLASLGLA